MNTEKVNALVNQYISKSNTETPNVTPETESKAKIESKEETKVEEVKEDKTATATVESDEKKHADTTKDETTTKPVEVDKPKVEKKEYTKQEKIDYAFQKQKAKQKKLEARIRELEEELKNKPNNLKLDDFKGNVEDYTDYKTDRKFVEWEKKRLEDEYRSNQSAEFEEINNSRIANCFPNETDANNYRNLIRSKGPELVSKLDQYDTDSAVLSYLDDSDIAPLITSILINEPKYLDNVLSKRSPYGKYMAMDELAKKIIWARDEMSKRKEVPTETPKPNMPVIGTVTKSEAHKDSKEVFDPNAYLAKLKSKNKYHK